MRSIGEFQKLVNLTMIDHLIAIKSSLCESNDAQRHDRPKKKMDADQHLEDEHIEIPQEFSVWR